MAGNYSLFAGDDGLHRALLKIEATLPEEYRADVRAARARILIDTSAWYRTSRASTSSSYLETIRFAVLETHPIDILYPCAGCTNPPGMQWRAVEPYGLVFKGVARRHIRAGTWYLVAYCLNCHAFTSFRLSSIEDVRVCDERFTPHPDFDLQAYWQEARKRLPEQSVELVLRVTSQARYELKGNGTLLKEEPDGSVVVRIDAESFASAVSYALGLGPHARVISPARVRKAVIETAHAIAEQYDH